jgi:hypothetical protein
LLNVARFQQFLNGRPPDEALLKEYLTGNIEWIGLEFKTADREPTFGLRRTVAAFANSEGGDLFLGVNEAHEPVGTHVDPAVISRILNQGGAPARDDCLIDLVQTVRPPVRILLADFAVVLWLDVAAHGLIAASLEADGRLALFNRPGAESTELKGFDAIDFFRRRTRARLLFELYTEAKRIVDGISAFYVGPRMVTEGTVGPIWRILESEEWRNVATETDKTLTNNSYLGRLLSMPADLDSWENLPFHERDEHLRMRRLVDLNNAMPLLRQYLVNERVIAP